MFSLAFSVPLSTVLSGERLIEMTNTIPKTPLLPNRTMMRIPIIIVGVAFVGSLQVTVF